MPELRASLVSLALAVSACTGHHAHPAGGGGQAAATPADANARRIDAASVTTFLETRFAAQLRAGTFVSDFGDARVAEDVLGELAVMGIARIEQLAAIVPADFDVRGAATFSTRSSPQNAAGVLRDLMIIHDAPRYFEDAWNNHWVALSETDLAAPIAYGLDVALLARYGVIAGDDDGPPSE